MNTPKISIPGLLFRTTSTGNKSTTNLYLIHSSSSEVVAKFIEIRTPFKLATQIEKILREFPLDWTLSADDIQANDKIYRPAVFELEKLGAFGRSPILERLYAP